MVADEVQTGFGRTGRMFAMEHYGIEPDLIVVAKSIAAGLPLSGVIGKAEIMDSPHKGAIGGTYIGNPVALAAALAVLDVFAEEDLVARAQLVGDQIRERMLSWQERWPAIGDVRGLGAMLAIELVHDPLTKEPGPELAAAVIEAALQRGLILLKAGVSGNCIRVLCPLTIEDAVLDEGLAAWEDALAAVLAAKKNSKGGCLPCSFGRHPFLSARLHLRPIQYSRARRRSWRSSARAISRSSSSAYPIPLASNSFA